MREVADAFTETYALVHTNYTIINTRHYSFILMPLACTTLYCLRLPTVCLRCYVCRLGCSTNHLLYMSGCCAHAAELQGLLPKKKCCVLRQIATASADHDPGSSYCFSCS